MRPVLLAIAAFLSIALYRMISRGGKTYAYNRTQTILHLNDESEHISQEKEKGSITITNHSVIIDGVEYIYAPMKGEEIQAVLEYDNKALRNVRVLLPEGEKHFFIEQVQHSLRGTVKPA
jgi:hypothetical protein